MSAADVATWLHRKPFQAFRVFISDGTTYDIRGPEWMILTFSGATIGLPAPEEVGIFQSSHRVGLEHVVRVEPIEQPAKSSTNNN
jgi:hypothetical protein